jgi:hypothetical protein
MKITIDLPDMYVKTLSKWASVSRTLKNANRICEEYISIAEDGNLIDKAHIAKDELDIITQPLDLLHRLVRDELWREFSLKKNTDK